MSEVVESSPLRSLSEATAERPSLGRALVLTMAVAVALAVGNLYYIQPLLGTIGRYFTAPESTIGFAASLAQVGQTLGMMLLLPLGDIHDRRRLIFFALSGSVCALAAVALSPGVTWLLVACFGLGVSTFTTHLIVSYAASLARPDQRGRVVGFRHERFAHWNPPGADLQWIRGVLLWLANGVFRGGSASGDTRARVKRAASRG